MKTLTTTVLATLFALTATSAFAAETKKEEPGKPAAVAAKPADKPASAAMAADKPASAVAAPEKKKKKEKKGGC